jgi:hypothetical protein
MTSRPRRRPARRAPADRSPGSPALGGDQQHVELVGPQRGLDWDQASMLEEFSTSPRASPARPAATTWSRINDSSGETYERRGGTAPSSRRMGRRGPSRRADLPPAGGPGPTRYSWRRARTRPPRQGPGSSAQDRAVPPAIRQAGDHTGGDDGSRTPFRVADMGERP